MNLREFQSIRKSDPVQHNDGRRGVIVGVNWCGEVEGYVISVKYDGEPVVKLERAGSLRVPTKGRMIR